MLSSAIAVRTMLSYRDSHAASRNAENDHCGLAKMQTEWSEQIADAVRPVFFQTNVEEFLYATHGGTLFLVKYLGRSYALTCYHVFQDFRHGSLFITQEKNAKKGSKPAPVKTFCYPSSPKDDAVGYGMGKATRDRCITRAGSERSAFEIEMIAVLSMREPIFHPTVSAIPLSVRPLARRVGDRFEAAWPVVCAV